MNTSWDQRVANVATKIEPLFRGKASPDVTVAFFILSLAVLLATGVLIPLGRVDLALVIGWAAAIIELGLMVSGKARLKVPLCFILAAFGSVLILACSAIHRL